jgi:lincosamide nucleotidyltransferase B/F
VTEGGRIPRRVTREQLLERLAAISRSVEASGEAIAVMAVGSAGIELERLDRFSDLDFLVVVRQGAKDRYLASLDWLALVHPIAYAHRNTADGFKLLFEDGIFVEFGVLEERELRSIPYPPARVVWCSTDLDESLAAGNRVPQERDRDEAWLLGEILTNVYVGVGRFLRGEKLAALHAVQVQAVRHVIELARAAHPGGSTARDAFAPERRVEARLPAIAPLLPAFLQGYDATPASARAILVYVRAVYEVNEAMSLAIERLLEDAASPDEAQAGTG